MSDGGKASTYFSENLLHADTVMGDQEMHVKVTVLEAKYSLWGCIVVLSCVVLIKAVYLWSVAATIHIMTQCQKWNTIQIH